MTRQKPPALTTNMDTLTRHVFLNENRTVKALKWNVCVSSVDMEAALIQQLQLLPRFLPNESMILRKCASDCKVLVNMLNSRRACSSQMVAGANASVLQQSALGSSGKQRRNLCQEARFRVHHASDEAVTIVLVTDPPPPHFTTNYKNHALGGQRG